MAVVYGQIVVADQAIMETKAGGNTQTSSLSRVTMGCPCQPRYRQARRLDVVMKLLNMGMISSVLGRTAHWVQKVTDHLAFDVNVQ